MYNWIEIYLSSRYVPVSEDTQQCLRVYHVYIEHGNIMGLRSMQQRLQTNWIPHRDCPGLIRHPSEANVCVYRERS